MKKMKCIQYGVNDDNNEEMIENMIIMKIMKKHILL